MHLAPCNENQDRVGGVINPLFSFLQLAGEEHGSHYYEMLWLINVHSFPFSNYNASVNAAYDPKSDFRQSASVDS